MCTKHQRSQAPRSVSVHNHQQPVHLPRTTLSTRFRDITHCMSLEHSALYETVEVDNFLFYRGDLTAVIGLSCWCLQVDWVSARECHAKLRHNRSHINHGTYWYGVYHDDNNKELNHLIQDKVTTEQVSKQAPSVARQRSENS